MIDLKLCASSVKVIPIIFEITFTRIPISIIIIKVIIYYLYPETSKSMIGWGSWIFDSAKCDTKDFTEVCF